MSDRFCVHCPGEGGHKMSCSAAKNGYVAYDEPCREWDLRKLRPEFEGRITAPVARGEIPARPSVRVYVRGGASLYLRPAEGDNPWHVLIYATPVRSSPVERFGATPEETIAEALAALPPIDAAAARALRAEVDARGVR